MTEVEVRVSRVMSASAPEVFALLNDVDRFYDLRPGAVDHRDIVVNSNGGHDCTQEYQVRGRRFVQRSRNVEFMAPSLMVDIADAEGYEVLHRVELASRGDQCELVMWQRVTFAARLGPMRARLVRRRATKELEALIDRLEWSLAAG